MSRERLVSVNHSVRWPTLSAVHTIIFDFDGVFTDNKVYVAENGSESVRCDRADGLGVDFLRKCIRDGLLGVELLILSKETNPVVNSRAKKLQIECVSAAGDKLEFVEKRLNTIRPGHSDPFAGLIYLGNDLNDLPVMDRAGFSVAPRDAHPLVKQVASIVLNRAGGDGFVREFVERLLNLQTLSKEKLHDLVRGS